MTTLTATVPCGVTAYAAWSKWRMEKPPLALWPPAERRYICLYSFGRVMATRVVTDNGDHAAQELRKVEPHPVPE